MSTKKPLTMGDLFKGFGRAVVAGIDSTNLPPDVAPLAETLKEQILEATSETPAEAGKPEPNTIETDGETISEETP